MVLPSLPPRRLRGTSSRSGGRDSRPRGRGLEGDRPRPLDLREQRRGLTNCGEASTAVARRIGSAQGRCQRAPLGASEEGVEHLARQDRQHDHATVGATLALDSGFIPERTCSGLSRHPLRACRKVLHTAHCGKAATVMNQCPAHQHPSRRERHRAPLRLCRQSGCRASPSPAARGRHLRVAQCLPKGHRLHSEA